MRVSVLTENSCLPGFACEHGLSLFIETGGRRFLVDCGQSGCFVHNARLLDLDLHVLDCAFLSHSHYDHGNGLVWLFRHCPGIPVYAQPACLNTACWKKNPQQDKYIGLDFAALSPWIGQIHSSEECRFPNVHCLPVSHAGCRQMALRDGLYVQPAPPKDTADQSSWTPDDFAHEQALVFVEEDGAVVVCSCSHAGADHILDQVHRHFPDLFIKAFIGGFHLKDAFGRMPARQAAERIDQLACRLMQETGTRFYTGHCTGDVPYARMKAIMRDALQPLASGLQILL